MNKSEIVEAIAKEAGITKADAERALNAFQTVVAKALTGGKKITLTGFGTYAVSTRKARNGRNPRTGATVKIPARKAVTFKVGSKLKDAVNK